MTAITYPFAPTSLAALLDVEMPSTFSKIHSYILYRLQLPDWKLSKTDVANRFNISMSTVKRAFRWLREHGYLKHIGFNNWQVYPSPNLPMGVINEPLERVINEPLYIEVSLQKNITTTPTASAAPTPTPTQNIVVVIDELKQDELIYPKQLDTAQKKDAKRIIKKLKQPELSQPVLLELAYILTTGRLKTTIPRCLGGLVSTANEQGYFTYSQTTKQATDGTISNQASIAKTLEMLDSYRAVKKTKPDGAFSGLRSELRSA
jgi:DNA-binding transcriptional regulator YhcF (GntR family)